MRGFKTAQWAVIAAVLAAVGAVGTPARAQAGAPLPEEQWATEAQVTKLIDLMRLETQLESIHTTLLSIVQQLWEKQLISIESRLGGRALTEEQKEKFTEVQQWIVEQSLKLYTLNEIKADAAAIYGKYIRSADMDAIIAFYQSAAGQRFLEALPGMTQEVMLLSVSRTQERARVFGEEVAAKTEALIKSIIVEEAGSEQ